VTRFGRAQAALNIDIICANTPQATGRVERMNKTLQDRLVKELRLRGVSGMPDGNALLPTFMADHNRRFGRSPQDPHDAHRPLSGDEDLDHIFAWQEGRLLPYSIFDKNPIVSLGAIVENKRLGAVLAAIQASQAVRDQKRLASKKLSLREKERLRCARAKPGPPDVEARPAAHNRTFLLGPNADISTRV